MQAFETSCVASVVVAAADAGRAVVLLDELVGLGAADEGEERRVVRARRRRLVDVDAGLRDVVRRVGRRRGAPGFDPKEAEGQQRLNTVRRQHF